MNTDVLTKRVALYARISTKDKGQTVETQLLPLRAHIRTRDFVLAGEYVDVGISGAKQRRPHLDRLMIDARLKRFDVVLVARFDRFARSVSHLLRALEEFNAWGVDFISLNEAIDTSTPAGRLVFTILGAVAEMERSIIKERVRAGLDRARKEGRRLGRPRVLVDEVKLCEQYSVQQMSLGSIGRHWKIAPGTARAILRRRGLKKPQRDTGKTPTRDAMEVT